MLDRFRCKIFADGADLDGIVALAREPHIDGFTTNPTLMWKAGLTDYEEFGRRILDEVDALPISFEVFADEAEEMRRQAKRIATWGDNVYVKIPVSNTRGESMAALARALSGEGIKVNVTALFTRARSPRSPARWRTARPATCRCSPGASPTPASTRCRSCARRCRIMAVAPRAELIWASPRELLNLVQADAIGCHIITMTHDLLAKLPALGKDLEQFSLETVRMFHDDAAQAGFEL